MNPYIGEAIFIYEEINSKKKTFSTKNTKYKII